MNESRLSNLIAYLSALANLKATGHHVTLEITATLKEIEKELERQK